MDSAISKPTDVPARSNPNLTEVSLRVGGIGLAVWILCNALAVSVYLFDFRHTHSHPGLDVLIVHGTQLIASLLLLRWYNLGWRDAGFQSPSQPIRWFSNIAIIVLLNLTLAGIMRLFHSPNTHAVFPPFEKLLLLCGLVPIAEEIFFRGWFQAALVQRAGESRAGFAILGSATLFAAVHLFVGGGPVGTAATVTGAFLSGLIAARLRQQSRSLLPAISVHVTYNITGLFLATPVYSLLANILKR
jgi:membrane protease YdiL (CAAX protease family)